MERATIELERKRMARARTTRGTRQKREQSTTAAKKATTTTKRTAAAKDETGPATTLTLQPTNQHARYPRRWTETHRRSHVTPTCGTNTRHTCRGRGKQNKQTI